MEEKQKCGTGLAEAKEKPASGPPKSCRKAQRVTGWSGNHSSSAPWDMGGLFSIKIECKRLETSGIMEESLRHGPKTKAQEKVQILTTRPPALLPLNSLGQWPGPPGRRCGFCPWEIEWPQ